MSLKISVPVALVGYTALRITAQHVEALRIHASVEQANQASMQPPSILDSIRQVLLSPSTFVAFWAIPRQLGLVAGTPLAGVHAPLAGCPTCTPSTALLNAGRGVSIQ